MTTLDTKITDLESIIAPFNFNDKLWAAKSLNTTGNPVVLLGAWHSLPRNDTIAIYGDAVAAGYLCGKWLAADLPKGLWTTIRNDVLGNTNLAAVGFRAGLDACVHLNPGTNNVSNKTMATTIEAILGAVHRDGGDAALEKVMERLGLTHALLEAVPSYALPGTFSRRTSDPAASKNIDVVFFGRSLHRGPICRDAAGSRACCEGDPGSVYDGLWTSLVEGVILDQSTSRNIGILGWLLTQGALRR